MKSSLEPAELADYVSAQINYMFPDQRKVRLREFKNIVDLALNRVEYCFKHSSITSYYSNGQVVFNHLFSNQYAVFLWFLSNTIWKKHGYIPLVDKLFCLNKALHSFECMYDTQMPSIFFLSHTVGSVLGKAAYSDFLVVSQGCTVGNHKGAYPVLGIGVGLGSGASIIGDCKIGNRVSVGSDTVIFKKDIADDTTVYRSDCAKLILKSSSEPFAQKFFNIDLKTVR